MITPGIPGAINLATLEGDEIVQLGVGAAAVQTTTQAIANLSPGGSVPPSPFFGTALQTGWDRSQFTGRTWLNQGGQGVGPSQPTIVAGGINYNGGDTFVPAGGTVAPGGSTTELTVTYTTLVAVPTIVSAGSGGTPGAAQVIATGGSFVLAFQLNVTIGSDGSIASIDSIVSGQSGDYTANPPDLTAVPVADNSSSGITGAIVNADNCFGVQILAITEPGLYSVNPVSPLSQQSTSGSGTGLTVDVVYTNLATYIDGTEGDPLVISASDPQAATTPVYLTGLMQPLGDPPYTITVALAYGGVIDQSAGQAWDVPIFLYDSVNKKAVAFYWQAGIIAWAHYSNTEPPGSQSYIITKNQSESYFAWFRIVNDGTNITPYFSNENLSYIPFRNSDGSVFQEASGALTPSFDHVGVGMERGPIIQAGGSEQLAILWNWVQTSP